MNSSIGIAVVSSQVVAVFFMGQSMFTIPTLLSAVLAAGSAYYIPTASFANLYIPTTGQIASAYIFNDPTSSVIAGAVSGFVASRYL